MIDTQLLKDQVNILDIVQSDLGPPQRVHGDWHFWRCPFHSERSASFGVNESTQSWYCFGACHKGGNVIDYVMQYHEMRFKDACTRLEKHATELSRTSTDTAPRSVKKRTGLQKVELPAWQTKGDALVAECQARLHDSKSIEGTATLEWLQRRGISPKTIREAGLGCAVHRLEGRSDWGLPVSENQDKVAILPGVLIPWYEGGILKRLIIRRFPYEAVEGVTTGPYKVLPGSANLLYNADKVDCTRPVMLVEGVFDALSVQQEAGDMVHAVATGGIGSAHTPEALEKLRDTPLVLVSFDNDVPGDKAAEYWTESLPNARRWRPIFVKDPNEMLQQGICIRRWVETGVKSNR